MPLRITVPARFAAIVRTREGDAGAQWVGRLPGIVEHLGAEWGLTLDGAVRHGQVGLIVPVVRDTARLILKVSFPHPQNLAEGIALRAFGGSGAVELRDEDRDRYALLMERAGPATAEERLGIDAWIEVAADVARALAVPPAADSPSLAASTQGWRAEIEEQVHATEGLVPPAHIARTLGTVARLAEDDTPTLIHGDLHQTNVLEAGRAPWLAIDPRGWRGTPAWEGWTVAAAGLDELARHPDPAIEVRRRVRRFAALLDLDRGFAVELARARIVASLLWETTHGGAVSGRRLLARLTEEL